MDVLILGAGVSGLVAASYLQNNGIDNFLILEAQDYIGGRMKNLSFGGATFGEGANWVHYIEDGEDNPILGIAKKLNLSMGIENREDVSVK